ncbi:HlyD family efflux transporter periplasmic adaptor subunit [Tissierella praeacuta]|uniref:HlyD family efflux transporter periplasmic adaptor subunit n=1 Tax=Tissierella praeacuta TaxID=43131 RepID=UPI003340DB0C
MNYSEREKNRKRRKVFRTITISFVLLYFIFRSVPSLLASNAKTVLPEKGTLIEKVYAQGFVIKNETVVKSTVNGEVEISPAEGDRVAAGVQIASVNSMNDTSSLKQELLQIEESISALEKSETETKLILNEKEKVQELKESLVYELQNSIIAGKFDEVYLLKSQLAIYDEKNKDISSSNTLVGQSLENLKSKKDSINSEIKSNHMKYYTNSGGIISYIIDGYEEIYIPKDFENYTYDSLVPKKIEHREIKSNVTVDEPIYKVIDNFEWYIALKIEDLKQVKDFEVGNIIRLEIEGDKREIKGKIIAINPSKNKGVIIVRLNTFLHDLYNIRFPKVDIIKYKKEGYRIPTKSIVDKDSVKGVYIKDKSGIVKFRPIIAIGEEDNYTFVDTGDNSGNITIDDEKEPTRTISLFDEIFLNTINIKEGQIIN